MNRRFGFSVVEIILVMAIAAAIMAIGTPIVLQSYQNYLLTSETRTLVSLLRRAQGLALSNDYQSSHGLSIQPSNFVIFQGASYASRNTSFDENYVRSTAVTVSSTPEIVFAPTSGNPNSTATITLAITARSQTITINEQGTLNW